MACPLLVGLRVVYFHMVVLWRYFMYEQIVAVYVEFLQGAIPFAIVFGFGNLCVSVILRAAFGGRLVIK